MAKLLAFKRATRQVVVVDTVNATIADLGTAIAAADTTNAFPNRCENVVAVFRGAPYLLYRTATNEVRLSKLDIGTLTWADVPGFTAITTGTGVLTPTCLHVVKDRLTAVCSLSLSAGVDAVIARRSAQDDGDTWDPTVSQLFATQPLDTRGGPSIVWRNAVWFTTSEGIGYYDPDGDVIAATMDTGSDTNITGQKANFGSFTFFDNDLYYVLPTDLPAGTPSLYRLDKTWSTTAPVPTFQAILLVIPGVGDIIVNNDTGNYSLFVDRAAGAMALFYSGTLGSKVVSIAKAGSSFTLTDITATSMPSSLSGEPNLGFSFYADDRRRTNEKHTIIVRFRPAIPVSVQLYSWDGVSQMVQVADFDDGGAGLDLITPDEERSDFRTYTANEPSVYIDDTSQPFPGRVRLDYTVQDQLSRPVDVLPEYSTNGQTWFDMTQGDGDSGKDDLATTPTGNSYFFHWDAFVDLDGDLDNVDVRVVVRISGV